jgi:reductive dehalogenase
MVRYLELHIHAVSKIRTPWGPVTHIGMWGMSGFGDGAWSYTACKCIHTHSTFRVENPGARIAPHYYVRAARGWVVAFLARSCYTAPMSGDKKQDLGNIQRIDERDTVFSREALEPGTGAEVEYHTRFPERKEVDEKLRQFIEVKLGGRTPRAVLDNAVYKSHFVTASALALPDFVDGDPGERKIDLAGGKEGSFKLKHFALGLGASQVGIGPLNPNWVYSHRGCRPFFDESYVNPPFFKGIPEGYQGAQYGDPIELDHKNAIVMAFAQDPALIQTGPSVGVDFEVGRAYAASVLASVQLAQFIRALGFRARAHHLRNSLVILPPVAVDAGIGELARCGYVVSRTLGANFRLSCVTTDMPLLYSHPAELGMQDFCSKCLKCARTCPAQAIPMGDKTEVNGTLRWKLDAEKCLLYWGKSGYTCGICQVICPWSKPQTPFHRAVASTAVNVPMLRSLLVKADDWVYGAKYKRRPIPDWLE